MPEKESPFIERGLALLAVAGVALGACGLHRWTTSPRAAAQRPHLVAIQLQKVLIVARRDPADVLADDYAKLRAQVHWVPTKVGRETMLAPDFASRMLLAKAAAERAQLADVGLSFRDVYAIINAETSWVPRSGASRDGTPNLGIAQFEPATAKALGLRDPDDVVEAVHAAAMHMKEAALWSQDRLRGYKLGKAERAEKLREGISIYYNLSTRGRNQWKVFNTATLPVQTQRHIANAKLGAQEAALLDAQMRAAAYGKGREVLTAGRNDGRT